MSVRQDQAHRRAQERLALATSQRLAVLIEALPNPETQQAMDLYAPEAARIVAGGQQRSSQLAIGYVSQLVTLSRSKLPPTSDRALADVLVNVEAPVARSPMLRLWGVLGQGEPLAEAKRQATSYAEGLASGDLQAAERAGLHEAARSSGRDVKGWRKVLSSSPCEWCRTIAQATEGRYRAADSVPFHQRDRCGVAPVF